MKVLPNITKKQKLELELDIRMAEIWEKLLDVEDWSLVVIAPFLRAAYGLGYVEALKEEESGKLLTETGYQVSGRKR